MVSSVTFHRVDGRLVPLAVTDLIERRPGVRRRSAAPPDIYNTTHHNHTQESNEVKLGTSGICRVGVRHVRAKGTKCFTSGGALTSRPT